MLTPKSSIPTELTRFDYDAYSFAGKKFDYTLFFDDNSEPVKVGDRLCTDESLSTLTTANLKECNVACNLVALCSEFQYLTAPPAG